MTQPTILIIDDSEDDVVLTKAMISKIRRAVRVEYALNGEAGMSLLREVSTVPQLILLDLKMPGMDGLDVLRELRRDERLRQIPVVVLTNSDLKSDREAAIKAGANKYLQKAHDLNRLKQDLELVLVRWLDAHISCS